MNEWIKVEGEDSLPKEGITVLVCAYECVKTGYIRSHLGNSKNKWGIVGGGVTNSVTYWMELPHPPLSQHNQDLLKGLNTPHKK